MKMYLHDSPAAFRFVLHGELVAGRVLELEHAWTTSKSILAGKELVVDVSGLTRTDAAGIELLSEMRQWGARLTELPSRPPNASAATGLRRLLACAWKRRSDAH